MPKRPVKSKRVIPKWLALTVGVVAAVLLIGAIGGTAYALHLEENDGFCASCHTEPETTYFNQALTKPPVSLAAFHAQSSKQTVRCIDCHSGGGALGRVDGLMQGQTDLLAYWSGHYHSPAVTTNPLGDDSCLKCHADVVLRGGFDNHFHSFLARWQQVDPNAGKCISCHTAHTTDSDTQTFLKVQTVRAVCDDCHRNVSE
jgi:predicted CXXCH cytochrome family protein